jgi:cobalt-zinc-cadmium efflux system protein
MGAIGFWRITTPDDVHLGNVRNAIAAVPGVADVHDLHVWALTSGVNALSVHVVASNEHGVGELLTRVGQCATERFRIAHVTVQVEPPNWKCHGHHQ